MAGWSKEHTEEVRLAFYDFLNQVEIKSKEAEDSWIVLGKNLYGAQTRVIDAIFTALESDIHDIKILKSRQLGISTVIRALMLFWLGLFEMTGSLMFDMSSHLDEARQELLDMLERLPESYKFPRKVRDNRYSLSLANRSRVNLVSAGVKESKGGKGLGSGSAIAVSHRSELCSYGNISGLEGFRHSLARVNPNRLFVDESTAKGFNIWYNIWTEAKKDHHCLCIFVGWWSHPDQKIDRDQADFGVYGLTPPSEEEIKKIDTVWRQYGHRISPEQLAWIRREMNPAADESGDAEPDFSGDPLRIENQPWSEEEAFQMTGSVFFDSEKLTEQATKNVSRKFKSYAYTGGIEFTDFRVFPAPNAKSVQLKVWEPPVEDSVYVVADDPAFGHSERSDRSCCQVLRCFSDGLDQVAEFAWPLIDTRQFAWVIASLEGWYAGEKSQVYRIIELNGPGDATFRELQNLRQQLQFGYFGQEMKELGLQNIQKNVRNYIYTRTDSLSHGNVLQWKTNQNNKIAIFERARDFTNNGMLKIRSQETLEEMRTVTREGDSIEAQGDAKDDRVFALALGVRAWEERARRPLMLARRTRANEESRRRLTIKDQVSLYNQNLFESFLAGRGRQRRLSVAVDRRKAWRG